MKQISYFPKWTLKAKTSAPHSEVVLPTQRLPWPQMILLGIQHVVTMFGATVLAPLLMGFDPNTAVLMSGIGTLIFFVCVRGRVPSYLGSSFAFISGVRAVTQYPGSGLNADISIALGGIVFCGLIYTLVGWIVIIYGTQWINKIMNPLVTGTIVISIGLNLAPTAVKGAGTTSFSTGMCLITILCIALLVRYASGYAKQLTLLLGLFASYCIFVILTHGFNLGPEIDFTQVKAAPWFGFPRFTIPTFHLNAISMLAPIALVLVAENLGHLKVVSELTHQDISPWMGRAFIGDGLATIFSAFFGGTGVTTYAENIGVMALTKVYSTLTFVVAAFFAIFLGLSPKFGALIQTIPPSLLSGISIVVFGLIALSGIRIWVDNKVNLAEPRNIIVAAVPLIIGTGDFTIHLKDFSMGGIGSATLTAIFLSKLMTPQLSPKLT